jgi:hypothetical protein
MGAVLLLVAALGLSLPRATGDHPAQGERAAAPQAGAGADDAAGEARARVRELLRAQGLELDLEAGWLLLPASVLVRDQLLEYLLVAPGGASHESLFQTRVTPSLVHTAMTLLGFRTGNNAEWVEVPTRAVQGSRLPAFEVIPPRNHPEGPDLFLYAGWYEDGELYFYRVEDLIADLDRGRAMRRAPWVYLGSRQVTLRDGDEPRDAFAADVLGNLINISFFSEGVTLATAALPECVSQTIWTANPWLVPERGTPVGFVLSREPIDAPGAELAALLPVADAPAEGEEEGD